jgi:CBS domain-containing protein
MSSPAICINSKSTIDDATKLMEEKNLGFLPVTENDVLVGVITDRDILLRGKGKRPDTQINKIMTKNIIHLVNINDSLESAAQIMAAHKIRRLVVIEDDLIKGVITSKDLLYEESLIPYIKQTYLNASY